MTIIKVSEIQSAEIVSGLMEHLLAWKLCIKKRIMNKIKGEMMNKKARNKKVMMKRMK